MVVKGTILAWFERKIQLVRRQVKRLFYRWEHGFWLEETYNLDVALADWLATRLKALAAETQSYPAGYGGWMTAEKEYETWTADILKHATSCNRYARRWYLTEGDESYVLDTDYREALKWLSEYYLHLWS